MIAAAVLLAATLAADPLGPGDHTRTLTVDDGERSYLVHIPPQYDPKKPTPVVLLFHGAASNGPMHVRFTGMNEKSDQTGFIAVYPNGTGAGPLLVWNVAGRSDKLPGDVKFVSAVLDDLAAVVYVDLKRVYATGCSMGGMMCYRLAAELSDRIAAIAPVAGTMAIDDVQPKRPVLAYREPDMEDAGNILSISFTNNRHTAPTTQYTRCKSSTRSGLGLNAARG